MTYCKLGDLAIVVEAYNPCNLGTIVHVIGLYSGKIGICAPEGDVIWLSQASQPMTYAELGTLPIRGFSIVSDHLLTVLRLFMLIGRLSTLVLISRQFGSCWPRCN